MLRPNRCGAMMNLVDRRRLSGRGGQLLGVALTSAMVVACQVPVPPVGAEPLSTGKVLFVDEFDGPAGSAPNPRYWAPDVGGVGWGNDELQFYTQSGNAFLDGAGNLALEADRSSAQLTCWYGPCDYVSGKVTTKDRFAQRYGLIEARAKAPVGNGFWTSFWLLGSNIDEVGHPEAGEIDVFEALGDRPRDIEQHAHAPGLNWGAEYVLPEGQSFADWHTYGVMWTPDAIEWQVDGIATRTLTREEAGESWVFDRPFYILINLSVGGDWPGPPNEQTVFPSRVVVDYVRVFDVP